MNNLTVTTTVIDKSPTMLPIEVLAAQANNTKRRRSVTKKQCETVGKMPCLHPGMYVRLRKGTTLNGVPIKSLCLLSSGLALGLRVSPRGNFITCGIVFLCNVINDFEAIYSSEVLRKNFVYKDERLEAALLWRAPKVKRVTYAELMVQFGGPVEVVQ